MSRASPARCRLRFTRRCSPPAGMRWRCGSLCCLSHSGCWDCWSPKFWCGAPAATSAADMLQVSVTKRRAEFSLAARVAAPTPGVLALFGRSGSGKTTLVNITSGLLRADTAEIQLDEDVLTDTRAGILVPPERRRIGYVFQEARLFPHRTVAGNLRYGEKRVRA